MKYKTLGVFTAALFCYGTGQLVFETLPAQAQVKKETRLQEIKRFLTALQTERNEWERARAATWLGVLEADEALEQLHKSLTSDVSNQVRINASNAIARINKKASVKKLVAAIPDNRGRTDVQLSIIRALGDMKTNASEAIPVLVRFLRSPSPYVREATVEALWKIRDPRVVGVLNRLLEQEKELVVKLTLTSVIADFRSPDSVTILENIVKRANEHVDVKTNARDALDKLAQMGL